MYTNRSEMKILGANVVVGSAADASAAAVAATTSQQQRDYRCSTQVKYNKYNNNNNNNNNGKSGNILRLSKYSSNNNNNSTNNNDCKNAKRQQQQQQQQQQQHMNYNNNVHGFARKKYFGSNNNNNNYNCNQQQQQQSPYYKQQQQQQQVATSGAAKLSNNNNNNNQLIKKQNISDETNCKVSNDSNNNNISSKDDDSNNNNNSSCNNNNINNAVPKSQTKTNNSNNKNIVKKRNSLSSNTESSCSSGYYRSCSESSITQTERATSSSPNNNKEDNRQQQQQQQQQHSTPAASATAAGEDKTTTKRKLTPTNGKQDNSNKGGQRSRQQPLCFWKTSYPQQPTMQQKEQQLEAALANQKEAELAAAAAKTAAAAASTSATAANAEDQQHHYNPHHYYSQPKQLTIASFLQKDLLPEMQLLNRQHQQQQHHQKQQQQHQQHSSQQQQQQSGGYQQRYRNVNYNYNNNHYQHHNTHHQQHQQHQQQHQQQQHQQHNHSNNHNHMHNQSFRRNKKMHFMSNTTPTQSATRSGTMSSENNYTSHRRVQQSAATAVASGGSAGDGDDGGVAVAGKNGYYPIRQHQYYSPKAGKGQFVSADYQNFYNLTYVNVDAKQPVIATEAQAAATVAGMQTLPSLLLKPLATGACAGPTISPPPAPIDAAQFATSATAATATTTVAATVGRNMFLQPPPTLQLLGPGMLSPVALTPDSVASTPTNMISCAQLDEAITAAAACNTSGSSSCNNNNNNNNSCSSSSSSNNIELGTVMTVPSPSYVALPFMLQHQQQQLQQQQLFFNNNGNAWGHPHSPCYSSGYVAAGNNNNMQFHREVSPAPSNGSQSSESQWSRLTPTDLPPALSPTPSATGSVGMGPQLSPHSLTPSLHVGNMSALHTILPFSIPPPPPHTHMGISLGNSGWAMPWFDLVLPPDRYLDHSHSVEVTAQPEQLLCHRKNDNLSMDIWTRFCGSQQTQDKFKIKMRLWRYLYVWINQYAMQQPGLGRFRVCLVGSTITGFGTDTSDIDMCLLPENQTLQSQLHQQQHHYNSQLRAEALMILTLFHNFLKDLEAFHEFNLIEARVPILRFKDRINGIEIDLNYNNSVGIKNTYLLQLYAQLDWRARPLVVVVKLWAQYHNINDAKRMTISSYSLVLMVLHYLQCGCVPHVLPCLQSLYPDKFNLSQQDCLELDLIESIEPYQTHNKQTLGEHLLGFLKYYSNFDFRSNAISIRTGGILPVNACRLAKSPKNDMHQWKELNIEEPFDLSNTARSVYDYATFERVKAVFWNSARRLEQTLDLASIFTPIQHTQRVPMQQPSFFFHSQIPHHSNPHPHPHSHPPHAHQAQAQVHQQPTAQQPSPPTAEPLSQTYPQLLQAARSTAIGATTTATKLINSGNFVPAASHVETGR